MTYATGIEDTFSFSGEMRVKATLIRLLKEQSDKRGRRCREIVLPPTWESRGIYSMDLKTYTLAHNFTGETKPFPEAFLTQLQPHFKLRIESNFSEVSAAVVEDGTLNRFVCQVVLPNPFPEEAGEGRLSPGRKRQRKRLALTDAPPAVASDDDDDVDDDDGRSSVKALPAPPATPAASRRPPDASSARPSVTRRLRRKTSQDEAEEMPPDMLVS